MLLDIWWGLWAYAKLIMRYQKGFVGLCKIYYKKFKGRGQIRVDGWGTFMRQLREGGIKRAGWTEPCAWPPHLSYLLIKSFPESFFLCNLALLCVRTVRSKCQQLEKGLWVPGPGGLAVSNWRHQLVYERPKCQWLEKPECVNICMVNLILYACLPANFELD